jgi:hypothetical protein
MIIDNSKILILYNSVPYFVDHLLKKGVSVSYVYRKTCFLFRGIKKIYEKQNLFQELWYESWRFKLNTFDVVIVFAPVSEKVLEFIYKKNKNIRLIYWHWNPVSHCGIPSKRMRELAEIWSFDPEDCINYNLIFNTTFYFKEITILDSDILYDVVFVGRNKGRRSYLVDFSNKLKNLNLNTYFHIVPDHGETGEKQFELMSYKNYLSLISKSKVLLDIKPKAQTGLTLRVMESIFFNNKLITDDLSIVSQDFYNKQNIFILGLDDEDELSEFIHSEYLPIERSIIERYFFINWLERFELR